MGSCFLQRSFVSSWYNSIRERITGWYDDDGDAGDADDGDDDDGDDDGDAGDSDDGDDYDLDHLSWLVMAWPMAIQFIMLVMIVIIIISKSNRFWFLTTNNSCECVLLFVPQFTKSLWHLTLSYLNCFEQSY